MASTSSTLGPLLRARLHELGVRFRRETTVQAVAPGGVSASELGARIELEADAIVLVTQRLSNEELYLELKADEDGLAAEGVEALYRIGDCVAPRTIADAIFDGHRLAREIDCENPAVPLPHKRERMLVAAEAIPLR